MHVPKIILTCLAFAAVAATHAAVTEQEAAKLGHDLTPMGAERAGSADGVIPPWTGGDTKPPANWKPGQARPDPYAADAPLFTIDAGNVDKYKDKLTEGQVAMIRRLKGYTMKVYPTRRVCGYSDGMYERTRANATGAKLAANGIDLEQAVTGGVPFPIPKNGAEAIWNHKLHYTGEGRYERYSTVISSPHGLGEPLVQDQWTLSPFGDPKTKRVDADSAESKLLNEVVAPTAHVGELILLDYFLNKPSEAWLYFPGQRRVRRSPTFAYDNPVPGYENMLMVDQYLLFSGPMDRYDWKLIGKQELIVPYSTFRFNDPNRKITDVFGADYAARDLIRYETHRVWKVEATVKAGQRHTMSKRVIYLDEDTWMALASDGYDAQGKLWRAMEAYPYTAWELPACVFQGYVSYDLAVGRYAADGMTQEGGKGDWLAAREGRIDAQKFNPDELRRQGSR